MPSYPHLATPPPPSPPPKKKFIKLWHKIIASKILLISILVHFLAGVGATYYVVQISRANRKNTFQNGPPTVKANSRALEHQVSMAKKKNTMSAPAQAKRITTAGLAHISLPEMPSMPTATEITPNKMSGLGGNGTGFGIGGQGGMGTGGGGFGFNLPVALGDRCTPAARAAAMSANGGDPKSEQSIQKGLRWLKEHQNGDGSWGDHYHVSMTGLALLSFMGHCERPNSAEFGGNVRKAIDYLVEVGEAQNGKLTHTGGNPWVYEHAIATYALSEAFILTKEPKIGEVVKKAVSMIVKGQGRDGGWAYEYNREKKGDTSVTGWQVQALKAANLTGLGIDGIESAMHRAADDIMRVRGKNGGFGYVDPDDKWSLTGVGILSLQVIRHERGEPVRKALHFAVEDTAAPKINYSGGDGANLYAWYYLTQACFQHGGNAWHKWNREFQPEINDHQSADGSWPDNGSKKMEEGNGASMDSQVYRTTLCILMLEVYYRYLASNRMEAPTS